MSSKNSAIRPSRAILSLSALTLLVTGAVLYAGPLDPPAGPVTSTYKTLSEVEPRTAINANNTPGDADSLFKITQPGSYYLTGNITGVVGKHGIKIVASGVTLDLNGFDLVGVAAMGSFSGVIAQAPLLTNIAVVNGSVRSWGYIGVDLGSSDVKGGRVEGVRANGNALTGINGGATIVRCVGTNGQFGITSGSNATISECSASGNSLDGIYANSGSTVSNCSASNNGRDGIDSASGCTIITCSAISNAGAGIDTGAGCTVTNCSAYFNSLEGITVGAGNTVESCTARGNGIDGILCPSSNVIRNNTCAMNGINGDGAGIHVTGIDNRIEGNNCTGADCGIRVISNGNFIAKNTCRNNPLNWDVVAGNVILVVVGNNAPAVNGISGGSAPGSSDPNANFTY